MTSPLPPKRRDSRNLADLIRQDRTRLAQLDRGLVGGRFSPARPLKPRWDDDAEDDGSDVDTDSILFRNADRASAMAAGTVTVPLTYLPIDGSLHVRWNGLDQPPTDWTLSGQNVVFNNPHVHVGDVLTAAYAYFSGDVPGTPGPASATLRDTGSDSGSNGPSLTSLAMPPLTQVGDLLIISGGGGPGSAFTVSDSRLTAVGTNMWIGFATSLGNIAATANGGFGVNWSIACLVLATDATGWTAPVLTSNTALNGLDTMPVGVVSNIGATVCAVHDGHSTVSGNTSTPTGYTTGIGSTTSLDHARVDFWTSSGTLETPSPSGPLTFTGGTGSAFATVVGLIGPAI